MWRAATSKARSELSGGRRWAISLGSGLINMIEMAPETAKRCKEKRAGRCLSIDRAVRRSRSQPFRRPEDVVHLSGYFVAKGLKTERFPAPSLLVSGQMASHHFDQINGSGP